MGKFFRSLVSGTLIAVTVLFLVAPLITEAAVYVRGYTRKDGTYVAPHYRSNPDGNPYNNWSYPGNTNPYTGETAGGNPGTYLNNYYGGSSGSNSYSPSYTSPSSGYSSSLQYVTGGYTISGILYCNSGYYKKNGSCLSAPANSSAYGENFYCNSGYYQSGDSCVKPSNGSYYGGQLYCDTGYRLSSDKSWCMSEQSYCTSVFGFNSHFDSSSKSCKCNAAFYFDKNTNQCSVTLASACASEFGPYSVASGMTQCTCISGYQFNTEGTQCVAKIAKPTRVIKSYVKNLAEYVKDSSCSQMGLVKKKDISDCNFYRSNKDSYIWVTN